MRSPQRDHYVASESELLLADDGFGDFWITSLGITTLPPVPVPAPALRDRRPPSVPPMSEVNGSQELGLNNGAHSGVEGPFLIPREPG